MTFTERSRNGVLYSLAALFAACDRANNTFSITFSRTTVKKICEFFELISIYLIECINCITVINIRLASWLAQCHHINVTAQINRKKCHHFQPIRCLNKLPSENNLEFISSQSVVSQFEKDKGLMTNERMIYEKFRMNNKRHNHLLVESYFSLLTKYVSA